MTIFADEAEAWKCPKHPSKRRGSGVCPVCLRDRLVTLCPDCANVRPCSCCVTTSSSSSSSSPSSSFSRLPVVGDCSGAGAIGLVSELIESEPLFRRSCSVAVPFLCSQSKFIDGEKDSDPYAHDSKENKPATSFLSLFRKSKKTGVQVDDRSMAEVGGEYQQDTETPVMRKSRSMAAPEFLVPVPVNGDRRERQKHGISLVRARRSGKRRCRRSLSCGHPCTEADRYIFSEAANCSVSCYYD